MTFRNVEGARGVTNVNSPPVSSWRIPTPLAKVIRVLIDKQIDAVTGMTVMTFLLLAAATDTIEHMYEAPREDIERIKAQAHEMAQNKH
jgi:hypothetical protein